MKIARCFKSIQLCKGQVGDGAEEQSGQEHEDEGNSGCVFQLENE